MVKLLAKSPAFGLLPVTRGPLTLSDVVLDTIHSVAPFKGQEAAVSKALKSAIGVTFPAPNRSSTKDEVKLLWSGQGQAFLIGATADLKGAAVSDQSDAWTCLALHGTGIEDVLARLTPLDLRAASFAVGHTARSLLGHMNALFFRSDPDRIEVFVFRSMAQTAVHELTRAMDSVIAQSAGGSGL